jgi:hypothetical protein
MADMLDEMTSLERVCQRRKDVRSIQFEWVMTFPSASVVVMKPEMGLAIVGGELVARTAPETGSIVANPGKLEVVT